MIAAGLRSRLGHALLNLGARVLGDPRERDEENPYLSDTPPGAYFDFSPRPVQAALPALRELGESFRVAAEREMSQAVPTWSRCLHPTPNGPCVLLFDHDGGHLPSGSNAHVPRDEPLCGRLLVGRGTDQWDPTCARPAGHDGACAPTPPTWPPHGPTHPDDPRYADTLDDLLAAQRHKVAVRVLVSSYGEHVLRGIPTRIEPGFNLHLDEDAVQHDVPWHTIRDLLPDA